MTACLRRDGRWRLREKAGEELAAGTVMYPGLEQLPDASRDPTVDLPFGQYGLQDQKAIARPRAEDLPRLGSALHPVPGRSNALGVKGVARPGPQLRSPPS